eukprot:SAG11_NODE_3205_length_2612_cov_1.950657_1_plen_112_part_00
MLSLFGVLGIQIFGGALTYKCDADLDVLVGSAGRDLDLVNGSTLCPPAIVCPHNTCHKVDGVAEIGELLDANTKFAKMTNRSSYTRAAYDRMVKKMAMVNIRHNNIISTNN